MCIVGGIHSFILCQHDPPGAFRHPWERPRAGQWAMDFGSKWMETASGCVSHKLLFRGRGSNYNLYYILSCEMMFNNLCIIWYIREETLLLKPARPELQHSNTWLKYSFRASPSMAHAVAVPRRPVSHFPDQERKKTHWRWLSHGLEKVCIISKLAPDSGPLGDQCLPHLRIKGYLPHMLWTVREILQVTHREL